MLSASQYTALDTTKEQIRLLAFTERGLKLQTFEISSCPPYTALSYTWGSRRGTTQYEVSLNGRPFIVTYNLHHALKALRSQPDSNGQRNQLPKMSLISEAAPELPLRRHSTLSESSDEELLEPGDLKYFWVDALCIDQDNVTERNHQVQMMKMIYSAASSVRVWLGEECSPALNNLKQQAKGLVDVLDPFFNSDYWQRVWTVQEFELAKIIVFMAGDIMLGLKTLLARLEKLRIVPAARILEDQGFTASFAQSHYLYSKRYRVMQRLRDRGQHKDLSLETLVFQYNMMECSDPRDTVYGLLGLATQDRATSDTGLMRPNYLLTPKQLCEQLENIGIESWRLAPALRDAANADLFRKSSQDSNASGSIRSVRSPSPRTGSRVDRAAARSTGPPPTIRHERWKSYNLVGYEPPVQQTTQSESTAAVAVRRHSMSSVFRFNIRVPPPLEFEDGEMRPRPKAPRATVGAYVPWEKLLLLSRLAGDPGVQVELKRRGYDAGVNWSIGEYWALLLQINDDNFVQTPSIFSRPLGPSAFTDHYI